jgi:hypothetical protein
LLDPVHGEGATDTEERHAPRAEEDGAPAGHKNAHEERLVTGAQARQARISHPACRLPSLAYYLRGAK